MNRHKRRRSAALTREQRASYKRRIIDLTGKRFGRWTVLALHPKRYRRWYPLWLCRCSCPDRTQRLVLGFSLRQGKSRSCGCVRREKFIRHVTKHGLSHSRPYHCWENMKQRCFNPNSANYAYYGGRDDVPITVCDEYCDFPNWYADIGYRLHD